jgi:reductive dehalogenase
MGDCQKGCEHCRSIDESTGIQVLPNFERFRQKDDVFNRASWDDTVRSAKAAQFFRAYSTDEAEFRGADGFGQRDYALRNASWYIPDALAELFEKSHDRREGFLDPYTSLREGAVRKLPVDSAAEMAREIKKVGKLLGADLVGICAFDERWVYTHNYSRLSNTEKPIEFPDLPNVIVLANEMDASLLKTVPSALSGAASGQGYSKDIAAVLSLAAYIRNLGYEAVASLNDSAMSIPLAIQAGLGEYGRHGLLITKDFGPRVRLARIFTDLPLDHDVPIHFGVRETCTVCRRCSDACPPKAIPHGEPQDVPPNRSSLIGVRKWTVDSEKCFGFWASQNTECSICIRVCPFNKDFRRWPFRVMRSLLATPFRRAVLWVDRRMGFGKRTKPKAWWASK